jgi:1-acyl-sn-glycerol-3-phosphate acyltransferase
MAGTENPHIAPYSGMELPLHSSGYLDVPSGEGYDHTLEWARNFWIPLHGGLTVSGIENLPDEDNPLGNRSFALAVKHDSRSDPVVIGSALYIALQKEEQQKKKARGVRLHQMARTGMISAPVAGKIMAGNGAFPVDRDQLLTEQPGLVRHLEYLSAHNAAVAFYPEGTTKKHPRGVVNPRQIHVGTIALAMQAGLDLYPAAAVGTGNLPSLSRRRWPRYGIFPHVHFGEVMPIEQADLDLANLDPREFASMSRKRNLKVLREELAKRLQETTDEANRRRQEVIQAMPKSLLRQVLGHW